jgi:hypothetical protein
MISLLLFLIYVVIDAIYDKDRILKKREVHTIRQYAIRITVILLFAILGAGIGDSRICFLAFTAIYWATFDIMIGGFLKEDVFYLSDKGLDGFQLRHGGQPAWFVWKAIMALAGAAYIINPNLFYY